MILHNLKLFFVKLKIFLSRDFEIFLLYLFTFLSIIINLISKPNYGFDAFIWIPLTDNFFANIGESLGIHRPLFAFIAYLINIPFEFILNSPESISWRFLNYLYFILSIFFCYKGTKVLFNSKLIATFTALSISISPQFTANLNVININLHGFFILFFTYFLFVYYCFNKEIFNNKLNLIIISTIFGILMLGKAHYNIFLAIIFFGLFTFNKKYILDTLIFSLIVILVLLLYMSILDIFNLTYQNYEIKRSDYSLLERFKNDILLYDSYFFSFYYWLLRSLQGSFNIIYLGLGPIYLLSFFYFFGTILVTRVGFYFLIYYVGTALFLDLTSFIIPRHAGDFSLISYLGFSLLLYSLKIKFFLKNTLIFNLILLFFLIILLIINSSNLLYEPIHGECYTNTVDEYKNFIAIFFNNFMLSCSL